MLTEPKNNKIFLNLKVETALRSYLNTKGLDKTTMNKYYEFFKKFSNVHVELNQQTLDEFLKYNNFPSARAMVRHLISAIVRWDFPQEMKDITYRLDIPKISGQRRKKQPAVMALKELEYLIERMKGDSFIDERNRLTILTQWWGGLRISEVLNISYDDLEVNKYNGKKEFNRIKIKYQTAKKGSERYCWVPTFVYKRIINYLKERTQISQNFRDKLQSKENIWGMGKSTYNKLINRNTLQILGRSYNTHSLRHGRATDLIKKGVPIEKVQRIMGHKDISSTQVYVHLSNEDIEDSLK